MMYVYTYVHCVTCIHTQVWLIHCCQLLNRLDYAVASWEICPCRSCRLSFTHCYIHSSSYSLALSLLLLALLNLSMMTHWQLLYLFRMSAQNECVHHSDTVICASRRGGCFASGIVSLVWWMFCCSSKGGVSVRVVCVCVCVSVCVCMCQTWVCMDVPDCITPM